MTPEQLAERIKTNIAVLVVSEVIPRGVDSFQELENYCDTNCLGGADELFGEMVTASSNDFEHQAKLDAFSAIHEPAKKIVDQWLKDGAWTNR